MADVSRFALSPELRVAPRQGLRRLARQKIKVIIRPTAFIVGKVSLLPRCSCRLSQSTVNISNGFASKSQTTSQKPFLRDKHARQSLLRGPNDFPGAFVAIAQQRPDILLVLQDALTLEYRKEITGFASREQFPAMYVGKEWVEEGGLMSYRDRLPERYRRAADLVDRILKGAKPADLPVEQPTTFELVVNLKTAKAIGLSLPPAFLARADQVIE
jgi:hypothetical protein